MNLGSDSQFVIVVCTKIFRLKFDGKLKGGDNFEEFVITQEIYDDNGNTQARLHSPCNNRDTISNRRRCTGRTHRK